jgi:hypothetical protein
MAGRVLMEKRKRRGKKKGEGKKRGAVRGKI